MRRKEEEEEEEEEDVVEKDRRGCGVSQKTKSLAIGDAQPACAHQNLRAQPKQKALREETFSFRQSTGCSVVNSVPEFDRTNICIR